MKKMILDRKARIGLSAALIAVLGLSAGLAVTQSLAPASAIGSPGKDVSDHALFDTTGVPPDSGAKCSSDKTFTFYLTVTAVGGPANVKINFTDSSVIFIPLTAGQTVSLVQAAGGTPGVDDVLQVTRTSGQIAGWVSLLTQKGAHPLAATAPDFCKTT